LRKIKRRNGEEWIDGAFDQARLVTATIKIFGKPRSVLRQPKEQGDDCPSSRLKHISRTDNSSSSILQSQESMPFENRERPGKIATFGNGE
jgi:hypothetical protein